MEEQFYESIFRYQKILHNKCLKGKLSHDQLAYYYHLLHLWSINYRNEGESYVTLHNQK